MNKVIIYIIGIEIFAEILRPTKRIPERSIGEKAKNANKLMLILLSKIKNYYYTDLYYTSKSINV